MDLQGYSTKRDKVADIIGVLFLFYVAVYIVLMLGVKLQGFPLDPFWHWPWLWLFGH